MSNTRRVAAQEHLSKQQQRSSIQQAPAIFVNATRMELLTLTPTHAGIVVSNSVVSAQIPLDVDQLRQLSANLLTLADSLQQTPALLIPSKTGLVLP